MLGSVCRALTRKLPISMRKTTSGFVRRYPIHFTGASVSSSCINYKRIYYGEQQKRDEDKEKVMSETDSEDEDEFAISTKRVSSYSSRKNSGRTEYYSDEESLSDSDSDPILDPEEHGLKHTQFCYTTLKKGSQAAREHMSRCKWTSLQKEGLCLVKNFRNVEKLMDNGIIPIKIFFEDIGKLLSLKGISRVQLFKIHPEDSPFSVKQYGKRPLFFGIFRIGDVKQVNVEKPALNVLPVTIIADQIENLRSIAVVLSAGTACGCSRILFTSTKNYLLNNYYIRSQMNEDDLKMVEFCRTWDSLDKEIDSDASIFLVLDHKPEENNLEIELVSLSDINFWKKNEIVIAFSSKITPPAEEFYRKRKARLIYIKGANSFFYSGLLTASAIATTITNQWEAKSKKSRKVIKLFNTKRNYHSSLDGIPQPIRHFRISRPNALAIGGGTALPTCLCFSMMGPKN